MPFFHLLSNSSKSLSVEFHGANVGCAFQAARQFCLDEAQLWQDGTYISTIRRQGVNRDYFIVFRENLPTAAGRLNRGAPRGAAPARPRELAA
jgi:hypothetical protein